MPSCQKFLACYHFLMNAKRLALVLALAAVLPMAAHAATFSGAQTVTVADAPPDNLYLAGTNVSLGADAPADVAAIGASVRTQGAIGADGLLAGGTVAVTGPVGGDLRAIGAQLTIASPVAGDVVVAGGTVSIGSSTGAVTAAGASVRFSGSAHGPVTLYGADVSLGGEIQGDVTIVATDRLTVDKGTHIHGTLRYNAPQKIELPDGVVDGLMIYTGSYAYIPTNEEAHRFAVAGAGIYFIVKALASVIVAGFLSVLFPAAVLGITDDALFRSPKRTLLLTLLGLAVMVGVPLLILVLCLSIVGIGAALLLGSLYMLLFVLSYAAAGILAGALITKLIARRRDSVALRVSWKTAALGTLALFFLSWIPYLGLLVSILFTVLSSGALSVAFFDAALRRRPTEF